MTDTSALPTADVSLPHADAHGAHPGHAAPPTACPNCGEPFALAGVVPRDRLNYCPHCGQETTLHPPSVGEFLHEFVGHYVALEGALWKTLSLLVLHPGRLTREYLAGRRRRYVLPLRLYLTASFIFFLLLKLMAAPGSEGPRDVAGPETAPRAAASAVGAGPASSAVVAASASASTAAASAAAAASSAKPARRAASHVTTEHDRILLVTPTGLRSASSAYAADVTASTVARAAECERQRAGGAAGPNPCGWFEGRMATSGARWIRDPRKAESDFVAHTLGAAPYAVFLMLPLFAGIVALAYRSRHMLFGEHLVFGMHLHAFWFLVAAVALLVPDSIGSLLFIAVLVHALRAQRRVYGGGWGWTMARAALGGLAYAVALTAVSTGLSFWYFLN